MKKLQVGLGITAATLVLSTTSVASAQTDDAAPVTAQNIPAGAQEQPGMLAYSYIANIWIPGQFDHYTGSSVGYEAAPAAKYPRVGDVF
ncbi:hypothetical protein N9D66_00740 [Candidatus Nanopelagicales bacterium]|nr:hypothetical protein [Candidatus Nanopelagicales bacterium]